MRGLRGVIAAVSLLATGCVTAPDPEVAPLRLATYAYPAYDRERALAGLAALIRDETGRTVATTLYPTPDALAQAIRDGHVDLAMTNLAAFISVADDPDVQPVAMLDVPAATLDGYRGVLLARREVGVATLADLPGAAGTLRYVETLAGSTSGALVQRGAFRAAAFDSAAFAAHAHAGTHDGAVKALMEDRADIAAAAERPWLQMQADRPAEAARLVQVWRSEPLPPGPVICVRAPTSPCDALARRLTSPDPAARTAAVALAAGWAETKGAERFAPYDAENYAAFVER